jgi:hypothetical protein
VSKEEALLMRENKERREAQERSRCQIGHVPGKPPSSCAESPKEMVDGLVLCEKHALETKLEGQIKCWAEMLIHIELWSREARRRERPDVVGLLEDQRVEAMSARHRAYEDLDVLKKSETSRSETPWGEVLSGREELLRRIRRGSPSSSKRRPAALSRASTSST